MKALIVIDMQNDFITGPLGTKEARAIVPKVCEKIKSLGPDDAVLCTADTHFDDYLETLEGQKLPILHCAFGTEGWELEPSVLEAVRGCRIKASVEKEVFGAFDLVPLIDDLDSLCDLEEIELVGVCTDASVISNAIILKSRFSETPISVDASCCAGTTVEAHNTALRAMAACQINIKNWEE